MAQSNYGASNITVLEGLEAVRKRPGMYIGNTGQDGLHRALGEIMDNSVDEFMAGHASTMKVVLQKDGSVIVSDDGRGIPTELHPKTGKSTLETILTVLHAGGKFDQNSYQFSGGLHGVGASVVNALSEVLEVWVAKPDDIHYMSFSKGKVHKDLDKFEKDMLAGRHPEIAEHILGDHTGTVISFKPDYSIFENVQFDGEKIRLGLQQMAYLNKGLKIVFVDERNKVEEEFCYPEGILTYLQDITKNEKLLTPIISFEGGQDKFLLDVAITYSQAGTSEKLFAFTNGIINPEGGMHVTGFKTALTKLINNYAQQKNYFKKDEKFSSEDLKEGVRVILSVKMVDPQFTSQSKVKLGSTIARRKVDRIVQEKLGAFLEENPQVSQSILNKAQLAMKARMAAKAARESVMRKGVMESMSLPGKLADCAEKDPEKSEIFIVEGDSAGGSAKQGRDRHIQAILPLRGKVLNTERATLDRIMNYEGIKNMIIAFGTGIGDKFDVEKLRYHKIILMTDADVDGAHITTLLLTFLYRYMFPLIEGGYVYMARPPLYKISWGKKKFEYVYSDAERDALIRKVQKEKDGKDVKFEIQRYKGLGEMNPDQLWETTMDPESRLLWQVTVGEAEAANMVFEELMGSDVAPRKAFIEENAVFADVDL